MRTRLLFLCFVLGSTTTIASAASWRTYRSTGFGFQISYPTGWHVLPSSVPGNRYVSFGFNGKTPFSVNVAVLPFKPASALRSTLTRFVSFQQTIGNAGLKHARWTRTTVGKSAAYAAIEWPPTEGGVPESIAVYVTQSRTRTYEIAVTALHRPAITRLSAFPSVYRQMLRTWRTL